MGSLVFGCLLLAWLALVAGVLWAILWLGEYWSGDSMSDSRARLMQSKLTTMSSSSSFVSTYPIPINVITPISDQKPPWEMTEWEKKEYQSRLMEAIEKTQRTSETLTPSKLMTEIRR